MSDNLDKSTIVAGFVALAAVLSVALLASSAVYADRWERDGHYTTATTSLWFGQIRR